MPIPQQRIQIRRGIDPDARAARGRNHAPRYPSVPGRPSHRASDRARPATAPPDPARDRGARGGSGRAVLVAAQQISLDRIGSGQFAHPSGDVRQPAGRPRGQSAEEARPPRPGARRPALSSVSRPAPLRSLSVAPGDARACREPSSAAARPGSRAAGDGVRRRSSPSSEPRTAGRREDLPDGCLRGGRGREHLCERSRSFWPASIRHALAIASAWSVTVVSPR